MIYNAFSMDTILHSSHWLYRKSVRHLKLTHWGRVTHICVGNLTIIGSDNGLSPGWRQAIIWTNAGLLLIGPLKTYFSEIRFQIQQNRFENVSGTWRPSCLGLNVLMPTPYSRQYTVHPHESKFPKMSQATLWRQEADCCRSTIKRLADEFQREPFPFYSSYDGLNYSSKHW